MSAKFENVRIVTFKEDYLSKSKKVLFRKGRTVAMHARTIAKLISRGAKADVKEYDYKKAIEKKKRELAELEKKSIEAAYA